MTLEGVARPHAELYCPVSGEAALILNYRASAQGSAGRIYGGLAGGALDMRMQAHQMVDFVLRDRTGAALIRVPPSDNVHGLHTNLSERFGFSLSVECEKVLPGAQLRVRGRVRQRLGGSPHRQEGYELIVDADSVEVLDGRTS